MLAHFIGPGKPYEIGAATVDGITFRHFKNAPRNLAVFFSERFAKYANQEFLVYESERLTFAQVQQQADALALALLDRYAIQRGDRVAIAARNYPEWCISFIAIASIGAVSVPLNSWWMGEELEYGLQDSGTKLVIADIPRFYTAQAALRKLNIDAIVIDRQAPDTLKYKNRPLDATTVRFHQIIERNLNRTPLKLEPSTIAEPDDAAAIMYTSGTTGHPKGVVLTHRGIVNQLFVVRNETHQCHCTIPLYHERVATLLLLMLMTIAQAEFGDAVQRVVNPAAVPSTQPCIICPIPLFHVTASHHIFLACFCSGRRLVLMYKWDVAQALQLIERERPTTWTGVPTMVGDLLAHPSFGKTDTSSLRVVGGGGAPTPPPQVKRTLAGFKGGAMPTQGYGLTETNGAVCQNTGENYINRPTSCGVPFPIVEAKVVDPSSGAELPVGSEGEIVFKSALVMRGYWNKPEATEQAIVSIGGDRGWFKTGDIAYIDADGFIHITDRAKDIIIRFVCFRCRTPCAKQKVLTASRSSTEEARTLAAPRSRACSTCIRRSTSAPCSDCPMSGSAKFRPWWRCSRPTTLRRTMLSRPSASSSSLRGSIWRISRCRTLSTCSLRQVHFHVAPRARSTSARSAPRSWRRSRRPFLRPSCRASVSLCDGCCIAVCIRA